MKNFYIDHYNKNKKLDIKYEYNLQKLYFKKIFLGWTVSCLKMNYHEPLPCIFKILKISFVCPFFYHDISCANIFFDLINLTY